ncbi:MAG: acetyl-CoA C-acyltransferase [Myxococcota bacterium]
MSQHRRAVVVAGARTPFVRAFAEFVEMDAIALGVAAVKGLLDRTQVPWDQIDSIVWGGVILPSGAPNVGREIALDIGLPASVEAMTVTRACASGLQAVTLGIAAIERGDADIVIAGGADSTSNAELKMPQSFVHKVAPVAMSGKSTAGDYFKLLSKISPSKDLIPRQPKIAERSTGEVMGEAAEKMAGRNGVGRAEQDAFTVASHQRAARAIESGRFDDEVVPVTTPRGKTVTHDTIVRGDTNVEKLGKLRPVFAKNGTLTAGNSSTLTDGAAAVLLMSEEKAKELGFKPKAAFRSWSYVGVDPADQLLMGPALAMPKALDKAGLTLDQIDVVDMHEAFAAQVLSVLKMLESDAFAKARLGKDAAVGKVDREKLNVHGGSVALGHPFGATGARMVMTMANELASTDKKTALLGICAAGGLGAAAVMEAVDE